MSPSSKVGFYPGTKWHAYQKLLARALTNCGYDVVQGDEFNDNALATTDQDVLHFHWIERLWDGPSYLGRIKCLLGVWRYLRKAKRLKKLIVWTVHNHKPHQNPSVLDSIGVRLFCWYTDIIACHSDWSKGWIQSRSIKKIEPVVVYHGNFDGVFFGVADNRMLKKSYCLDENKLCLGMIGEIRPNRGHELAIKVANLLPNTQLLIAGRCKDEAYLKRLKQQILPTRLNDITIRVGDLSDKQYNELSACADVCLLPYHNVTTSGALLSSWTIGTPVITSRLPYFEEMIPIDCSINSTFDLDSEQELIQQVSSYTSQNWLELREKTLAKAVEYDWDTVVKPLVARMQQLNPGR